ncbi:LamG domain-containing protein [Kribbella sp. NPDC058245]|uniref:LamG domain-containing protein n=1 Tax=Kribbella sp. NPDC058245 TaxID=3346399 RepID=UPI0036ED4C6A
MLHSRLPSSGRAFRRLGTVLALVLVTPLISVLPTADASRTAAAVAGAPPPVAEVADLAGATKAALRQGSRVEVSSLRAADRTVYAEPDGSSVAELSAGPVRVLRNNRWTGIDSTLARAADGSVAPKVVSTELTFSGGGTGPMLRLGKAGSRITLTWPGTLPTPELSESTATYREVLPGVDLVLRAESTGYTQHLVVRTREAAQELGPIRLGMQTEGLRVTATKTGALEARNTSGAVVFSAPPSAMWDSATPARRSVAAVAVASSALTISPDVSLLRDPKAVLPIVIDPNWATYGKSFWTSVSQGKPGSTWSNASPGGADVAQVGKCAFSDCNGIGLMRSYFQFDTAAGGILVGKRIMNVWLDSAVVGSPSCSARKQVLLGTSPIGPGITWSNAPGGWPIGEANAPASYANGGCGGWKEFSFAVPTEHINPTSTSTYIIQAGNEGDQDYWRKYDANATQLRIKFNAAPNAPGSVRSDPPLPAPCKWCAGTSYFSGSSVRLIAGLSDPDGEANLPQWDITTDGAVETRYGSLQANGSFHDTTVALTDGKKMSWQVRGWDVDNGQRLDYSPWTNGPGPFVVDRTPPSSEPKVTGSLYQQDNRWHGAVGVPGEFTFERTAVAGSDPGTADVDHYLWGTQTPPSTWAEADALGGKSSVSVTPWADGPQELFVRSVDRAGNLSPITTYRFYVREGRGPLAQWSFEGNAKDTASLGDRDGTLGGAAKYAPGAIGLGLQLNGTQPTTNMTAPNTLRTDASFSVSAWVKPQPLRSGQVMAIASQDGAPYNSGFYLQYRGDTNKWALLMLHNGTAVSPPGTYAFASAPAQLDRWSHVTGVYDRSAKVIRLFVNGVRVAEQALPENFVPWQASGPLVVGRQKCGADPCDPWSGGIDEVKVYDRALPDEDIRTEVAQDDVQTAHWTFEEAAGTAVANKVDGGVGGVLQGGATLTGTDGGAVGRGVQLDGVDGQMATAGPVVRTDQSFSVAAWVKLDKAPQTGWTVPVLAQDGTNVSGYFLWYRQLADKGVWEFYNPSADAVNRPADEMVVSTVPAKVGTLTHLAAVYDAPAKVIRLYVNGAPAGTAPRVAGFDATGPMRIGRGKWNGNPTTTWPGMIDEVRAYNRVISVDEVRGLMAGNDASAATWKLDGNTTDASANHRDATLHGGVTWTAGQTSMPDAADRALQLNGTDAYVDAPHAVDVDRSFTVSAWLRPDKLGGWWVPLSQDGEVVSSFHLQLTDRGLWTFAMSGADVKDAGNSGARAIGPLAQVGVWQHVVGSYDADRKQIAIHVNGVLGATASYTQTWNYPAGRFIIGGSKWNGVRSASFPGAIDDVRVYDRVLAESELVAMAGRDLGLAHNWTLDETSGTNAADSVGARAGTLNGPSRIDGRVGKALSFDGQDDSASTTGVDIDTSKSFTVSTWVRLRKTCDPGAEFSCHLTAISLDGGQTSKFRLGHFTDKDTRPYGAWIFEMPEADGTVTKASVSARESDLNKWRHLVGVYDAEAKQLWLYVDATRQGAGTLDTPWAAAGGLQLGRGLVSGTPAEFWPGDVDDVRVYAGRLDKSRIETLFSSYPALAG